TTGTRAAGTFCWRAQRLSASEGTSPAPGVPRGRLRLVLNACRRRKEHHVSIADSLFRSQLCSTPVGVGRNITVVDVHPRGDRPLCSTPVGVGRNITTSA